MQDIYTGIVLISVVSILMIAMTSMLIIKIQRLKIKTGDRIYKNKSKIIMFYLNYFCIIPIMLSATITLAILAIIRNNLKIEEDDVLNVLKLTFTIIYLLYVAYIVFVVLFLDRAFKNIYVIQKGETFCFLDGIEINIPDIYTLTYNVKKTILIIGYFDKNKEKTTYTIGYNMQLRDWIKNGLLQNPKFEELPVE